MSIETARAFAVAKRLYNTSMQLAASVVGPNSLKTKPVSNFAPNIKPNLNVNINQQNKHIVGTNEHKTANASSSTQLSIINPEVDIQKLVNKYAGTGSSLNKTPLGSPGSKERIATNKPIGNYFNENTGKFEPTNNFIIHYAKNGVHMVPSRP